MQAEVVQHPNKVEIRLAAFDLWRLLHLQTFLVADASPTPISAERSSTDGDDSYREFTSSTMPSTHVPFGALRRSTWTSSR